MKIIKLQVGDVITSGKFSPYTLYYGESVDFNFRDGDDDELAYYVINSNSINQIFLILGPGSRGLYEHNFKDASYFNAPQSQGTYNENY